MTDKIGGAVVTLPDGSQQHHANVLRGTIRRNRSSVAVVLTLVDGSQRVIEGATAVKSVGPDYLAHRAIARLFNPCS